MIPAPPLIYALIAILLLMALIRLLPYFKALFRSAAMTLFAIAMMLYAGEKHATGSIHYIQPDSGAIYLRDLGSTIEGGAVTFNFARVIIPETAALIIERRAIDAAADDPWTPMLTTTFADFHLPHTIYLEDADQFNFIVYTDWTPGPAVQTNGVWHANFGLDQQSRSHIIPIRAAVRLDDEVIATPKSKEDNRHE